MKAQPNWLRACASRCLAVVISCSCLWSANHAQADDWLSWGHDGLRARVSSERAGNSFAPAWRLRLPGEGERLSRAIAASPASGEGFIVFATLDHTLRVARARDGQELWNFRAGGAFVASPTIHRGRVFAPALDGVLRAFDLVDGKTLWSKPLGITHASATVVSGPEGDSLLLATGFPHRTLYRLDANTGKVLWQTLPGDLDRSSYASVAVAHGLAIVAVVGGAVHAFDVESGEPRWTFRAGGDLYTASPTIAGSTVFFSVVDAGSVKLFGVDLHTGALGAGWPVVVQRPTSQNDVGTRLTTHIVVSAPAALGDLLYIQLRFADHFDTGKDRVADRFVMRERLVAVSTATKKIFWETPLDERTTSRLGDIPTLTFCPGPAIFHDVDGRPLIAAASSVANMLRILEARSGKVRSAMHTGGPSRSSPIVANGLLLLGTDAGTLDAFVSQHNRPPPTPALGAQIAASSKAPLVQWQQVYDPEQQAVSYLLRLDDDGEVLQDWALEVPVPAHLSQALLPASASLQANTAYTVAIRARDSMGAWSDWSPPALLKLADVPTVTLGDRLQATLAGAFSAARAGDVISIGAGRYKLDAPLRVPEGVTVRGAGPQATRMDADPSGSAFIVQNGSADKPSVISHLTIAGAATGVEVPAKAHARLHNLVVVDCKQVGISVAATGVAEISNVTMAKNQIAVRASGQASVNNSLIVDNELGFDAQLGSALQSRYNDVFGNRVDRAGLQPHATDLSVAVTFTDQEGDDFRLPDGQPSTDQGDPAHDFALEPQPNGGRINLGAFGNTEEAERSAPPAVPPGDAPVATAPPPAPQEPAASPVPDPVDALPNSAGNLSGGGCSLARGAGDSGALWIILPVACVVALRVRRRKNRAPCAA